MLLVLLLLLVIRALWLTELSCSSKSTVGRCVCVCVCVKGV